MAKELVVISGKGGTGKTSITASFAALAKKTVIVDCDVDASDLHLILKPQILSTHEFYGGKSAQILSDKCISCGKCIELCKFNAISDDYIVNQIRCEGCGVCKHFCPADAIKFEKKLSGEWYESNCRFGTLIHAKLGIAEENSGKLVTKIRQYAKLASIRNNSKFIISDGSPGIGCPVIASITDVTLVLVVTEPTLSGLHDLERVLKLTKHFNTPACVCINKYDINLNVSEQIKAFCKSNNIEVLGEIPYTNDFTDSQIQELTLVEYSQCEATKEIEKMWGKIKNKLEGGIK